MLVDKPLDWTSARVINFLKKRLKVKKAGHSGTLDPRATGLLIICTGKKTKIISGMIGMDKDYDGIIRIGAVTKTYDTESLEQDIRNVSGVTDLMIEEASKKLTGEIMQIPPVHSAIKQNGAPVYIRARRGENVVIEARKVFVEKFYVNRISEKEVSFKVTCSKGTYIRSLAYDFGSILGVGAYLKELRRTRIGNYVLEEYKDEIEGVKVRVLDNLTEVCISK
ncbi:MAG: tRNA pseudouridine(55) synthase TruB [Ignavibacteriae bacterium]|nr:tRNA pseudouridine(55) synthase TruB [Ignavibacteriota bacterium]